MKIFGLTGSIATGKSYVTEVFARNEIAIFRSDYEVSKLLKEKEVIDIISNDKFLSKCVIKDIVDKVILSKLVFSNEKFLNNLEAIIHPLIKKKIYEFLKIKSKVILLEIPLLFENKYDLLCDKIITTYCSCEMQMQRALRRENIDKERLSFVMKRQLASTLKVSLSDYVIHTDISYKFTDLQIHQIMLKEGII